MAALTIRGADLAIANPNAIANANTQERTLLRTYRLLSQAVPPYLLIDCHQSGAIFPAIPQATHG